MSERIVVKSQYRRKSELKKKFRVLWMTFILILILVICLGSFISKAAINQQDINYKYYTCIEVKANDTLWSIANKYKGTEYASTQSYIDEVLKINNRIDEQILSGEQLIVPYYDKIVKL